MSLDRPSCPETVGSRFLSLLQSAATQTFSANFAAGKKPNCRKHSHERLGGSEPERYGKSLSEWPFLSEAWESANLLYKLFRLNFQRLSVVAKPESRHPFRLRFRQSPHRTD